MSRSPAPRVARAYDFEMPQPLRVEIHDQDCPCCAPPGPEQPLTFVDLGRLALAGAAAGSAIAFAIDAHGAWRALVSCFGGL